MNLLESLKGQLIVSCQAYPGEPMRHAETMAQVAEAVVEGGAKAIRLQGLEDIRTARPRIQVPIIGIVKEGKEGVFITPTLELARAVADAGAEIVALDATTRPRPDGRTLKETVDGLRRTHAHVVVMADCDSLDSVRHAVDAGCDILGTTLAGYTELRPKFPGPDLELLTQIAAEFPEHFVVAEGRVHTLDHALAAMEAGADAVVVGTAITHPTSITRWFAGAIAPQD